MNESRYRVVFSGALTGEFDLATTQARFAKLFGIDAKRACAFFSGKPRTLKSGLTEAAAMEYMFRVAEAGGECYIEEIVEGPPDGISERRDNRERRTRVRRPPRAGSIQPDRRLTIRRAEDRRMYLRLHDKGQELPLPLKPYSVAAAKSA